MNINSVCIIMVVLVCLWLLVDQLHFQHLHNNLYIVPLPSTYRASRMATRTGIMLESDCTGSFIHPKLCCNSVWRVIESVKCWMTDPQPNQLAVYPDYSAYSLLNSTPSLLLWLSCMTACSFVTISITFGVRNIKSPLVYDLWAALYWKWACIFVCKGMIIA